MLRLDLHLFTLGDVSRVLGGGSFGCNRTAQDAEDTDRLVRVARERPEFTEADAFSFSLCLAFFHLAFDTCFEGVAPFVVAFGRSFGPEAFNVLPDRKRRAYPKTGD